MIFPNQHQILRNYIISGKIFWDLTHLLQQVHGAGGELGQTLWTTIHPSLDLFQPARSSWPNYSSPSEAAETPSVTEATTQAHRHTASVGPTEATAQAHGPVASVGLTEAASSDSGLMQQPTWNFTLWIMCHLLLRVKLCPRTTWY